VFIGSTVLGLVQGTIEEAIMASIVGVLLVAVGAIGPEKNDEINQDEKEKLQGNYHEAGFYAFIVATVGGGLWLLYSGFDGNPDTSVAVFLALMQVPYLGGRIYLRRMRNKKKKQQDGKNKHKKKS